MPGTAVTQPNYADSGQSGSAYPTAIDAITQAMARIATAFNPHAVPAAAAAPVLTSSAGGALGARTYYSKSTLVTPAGEVAPSAESNLALNANTLLNVASPTFALGVTGWNVYVSTSTGTETKQNASPIAIGTAWVEPTGGLISGAALPTGLSPMAVIVDAGVIPASGALATEVAAQITGAITAPTTNPRKDIVYIDATTGTVGIATGTEAASPSDPAVPAGKAAVGRINCTVGMTAIANSALDDIRNLGLLGVAQLLGNIDALVFKGVIDCSANPNYPAADAGHVYRVSVAGKIGGASGPNVEAGDILTCITDGTASGNHATVGANWTIIQSNIDGAVAVSGTPAQGDILYRGAAGWERLAAGTSGHFLKTQGVGANPVWAAAASAFQAWESKTEDTVYQATTDGFVVGRGGNSSTTTEVRTDSSNPPTTVRHSVVNQPLNFCVPVKKNDYYTAVVPADNGVVYWIPATA